MTVLRASNAPIGLNKGKPVSGSGSAPIPWSRPSDWVTFTTPAANEQKVIGTVAIWNQGSNYIAFSATVSSGTYTVDWGDGTSANFTSGTTAEKNYVWGDISSSTLSSRGYRQAIITITPTTGGETFSAVNLNKRHSGITSNNDGATNPWLDVAIAAPNATSIEFNANTSGTANARMYLCEQINIVAHNLTSAAYLFSTMNNLQSVIISNTAAITSMNRMFITCRSLKIVPFMDTASVTTMTTMFSGCYSLETVPLFNTAAVTAMNSMFSNCTSLETVPLFNTAAVTAMNSMFNNCYSLKTVPLFNTSAVTNMSSMFSGCETLQTVPLFNTAAVTNMSSMFSTCTLLQTIPLFVTTAVTNMSSMFFVAATLQNVPELNLSKISSSGSNSLSFNECKNLAQAKLTGNRWTQSFSGCKMGSAQLDEMYTALAVLNPNVTNVTAAGGVVTYTVDDIRAFVANRTVTITGVNPAAYNLTSVTVGTVTPTTGNAGTFTVTNAATGTYVSGGVATLQDNKTITVTNNPGTTGDDPTIATNKGWTVTGS